MTEELLNGYWSGIGLINNFDNIDFGHIDIDLLILMLIIFYQLPVQLCLNITKILENIDFKNDNDRPIQMIVCLDTNIKDRDGRSAREGGRRVPLALWEKQNLYAIAALIEEFREVPWDQEKVWY